MMSGPFFIISYLFKNIVKAAIFYYLYLKTKAASAKKKEESQKEENAIPT